MINACVYVYYRVRAEEIDRAEFAARQIMSSVGGHHSGAGRLLRKLDEPLVWLEVYEDVADPVALSRALDEAAVASGIERLLEKGSRRNMEQFAPLCA